MILFETSKSNMSCVMSVLITNHCCLSSLYVFKCAEAKEIKIKQYKILIIPILMFKCIDWQLWFKQHNPTFEYLAHVLNLWLRVLVKTSVSLFGIFVVYKHLRNITDFIRKVYFAAWA